MGVFFTPFTLGKSFRAVCSGAGEISEYLGKKVWPNASPVREPRSWAWVSAVMTECLEGLILQTGALAFSHSLSGWPLGCSCSCYPCLCLSSAPISSLFSGMYTIWRLAAQAQCDIVSLAGSCTSPSHRNGFSSYFLTASGREQGF